MSKAYNLVYNYALGLWVGHTTQDPPDELAAWANLEALLKKCDWHLRWAEPKPANRYLDTLESIENQTMAVKCFPPSAARCAAQIVRIPRKRECTALSLMEVAFNAGLLAGVSAAVERSDREIHPLIARLEHAETAGRVATAALGGGPSQAELADLNKLTRAGGAA